jgi:hypothetical protein
MKLKSTEHQIIKLKKKTEVQNKKREAVLRHKPKCFIIAIIIIIRGRICT